MADGEVNACVRFKIEVAILTDSCHATGHNKKNCIGSTFWCQVHFEASPAIEISALFQLQFFRNP